MLESEKKLMSALKLISESELIKNKYLDLQRLFEEKQKEVKSLELLIEKNSMQIKESNEKLIKFNNARAEIQAKKRENHRLKNQIENLQKLLNETKILERYEKRENAKLKTKIMHLQSLIDEK